MYVFMGIYDWNFLQRGKAFERDQLRFIRKDNSRRDGWICINALMCRLACKFTSGFRVARHDLLGS